MIFASVRQLLLLSLSAFPCLALAQEADQTKMQVSRTEVPSRVLAELQSTKNVVYATYGDRALQLDVFRPKMHAEPLPAILCIHGGGWWRGSRVSMHALAQMLASHGYVAVTNSYRLSGESPFPAAVHDCKAAVRWMRANAKEYGIDPDAIGVTGLSAGGHLAALLATSGDVQELEGNGGHQNKSSRVQACYAMGAQADFDAEHIQSVRRGMQTPPGKPNLWVQFLGGDPTEVPERYKLASPRTHLDAGDPPLAFMAGENDKDATHGDSTRAQLTELGIATDLLVIKDAPHAFLGRQDWFDQAVNRCVTFFDEHLKHSGKNLK
tara:strand:+ start:47729 stop:48697 length:969 start_codon:yes stop_codon:yes gene_type:complete